MTRPALYAGEAVDPPKKADASKARGRGVLPKHLPRIEEVLAPDALICGCGAERHIIGDIVNLASSQR